MRVVLHKTDEDELNEATIAAQLEEMHPSWAVALADAEERNSAYDLIVSDGSTPIAYIEVKRRHIRHDQYETGIASKNKTDKILKHAAQERVVPVYVFWYDDGAYWISVQSVTEGAEGRVIRRKPRASGKWSKSDWGHDGYYFNVTGLQPLATLPLYIEETRRQWSYPASNYVRSKSATSTGIRLRWVSSLLRPKKRISPTASI